MYEYYSLNLFIPGGMSIGKRKLMLVTLGTLMGSLEGLKQEWMYAPRQEWPFLRGGRQ